MLLSSEPIEVTCLPNPFDSGTRHSFEVEPGATLASLMADNGIPPEVEPNVLLNGQVIDPKGWSVIRPQGGSRIAIVGRPHGDNAGRFALQAAVIVAAAYTGSVVGATYGPAWGAVATAAVQVGGMYLVNQIAPPTTPDPEERNPFEQPGIRGARNRIPKYEPIPKIYGKHLIHPPYAAEPFTEIIGSNQYVRMLFCVGYGPLDTTAIADTLKIGEAHIDNFETGDGQSIDASNEVGVQIRDLVQGDSKPDLFTDSVSETSLNITLTQSGDQAGSYFTRSTGSIDKEFSVDIEFPAGLIRRDKDGDVFRLRAEFFIQYKGPDTNDTWTDLDPDELVGPSVRSPEAGILLVTRERSGGFRVGFRKAITSAGSYDVRIKRYATWNLERQDSQAPSGEKDWRTADSQNPFITQDYYYRREDPDDSGAGTAASARWVVLRETNDANPIQFDKGVYIAMRIKATDQLNGVPDRINCVPEALLKTYDGNSWTGYVKTRRAAWAYVDMLTGNHLADPKPLSRIDADTMKAWADDDANEGRTFDLVVDEQKPVADWLAVIAGSSRASRGANGTQFSVVRDIERSSPVQMLTPRNSWNFNGQRTIAQVPHALRVQFINEADNWQMNERIIYRDGYSSSNATRFEQIRFEGVTDPDIVWKDAQYHFATAIKRQETFQVDTGVDNLVATRGDLVTLNFDVPLLGLYAGRITDFTVDNNVSPPEVTHITLDEDVFMESGKSYGIRIRTADTAKGDNGFLATDVVTDPSGAVNRLELGTHLTDQPEIGDLIEFGENSDESLPVLIKEIEYREEWEATLTCIPYGDDIGASPHDVYDADSGTIPTYTSQITRRPVLNREAPPQPTVATVQSDEGVLKRGPGGELIAQIRIGFAFPTDSIGKEDGIVVQAQFRRADPQIADYDGPDQWEEDEIVAEAGRIFLDPVETGDDIEFRLRSVTGGNSENPGLISDWTSIQTETVVGKSSSPPDVTGLTATLEESGIRLAWTEPSVIDVQVGGSYEIRTADSNWGTQNADFVDRIAATKFLAEVTGSGTFTYYVKAIDAAGNYSDNATSVSITISAPSAPANLALDSSETHLQITNSGDLIARIRTTWDAVGAAFVNRYEVQWKKSADASWDDAAVLDDDQTKFFVSPVDSGEDYDVRVRAITRHGVKGNWATITNHTVIGKTSPPDDVPSIFANQNGEVVTLDWEQVSNKDLAGYEIRHKPFGVGEWRDANFLTKVTKGTSITTAKVPPGHRDVLIKAVDTSGNYSVNAVSDDVEVVNTYDVLRESVAAPDWPLGVGSGYVEHWTGVLVPETKQTADNYTVDEIFDNFVFDPVDSFTYQSPEQDVGFDDRVRVRNRYTPDLGPGESGSIDALYEIDYRKEGDSYDGFESWGGGFVTARYIKQRITIYTSSGVPFLKDFYAVVDLQESTEGAESVDIPQGGTTITYSSEFHEPPRVIVTPDSNSAVIATKRNVTSADFYCELFDPDGTSVSGKVDWSATGI